MTSDLRDIRDRAASVIAWRQQHRDGDMPAAEALERAGSDAEGILVMCAEMAANDPARALARLFADLWISYEAGKWRASTLLRLDEARRVELVKRITPEVYELTPLGRAALAIAEDGG